MQTIENNGSRSNDYVIVIVIYILLAIIIGGFISY